MPVTLPCIIKIMGSFPEEGLRLHSVALNTRLNHNPRLLKSVQYQVSDVHSTHQPGLSQDQQNIAKTHMNPSKNCLNSVAKFADIESSMFLAVVRVQTDKTCGIRRAIEALPSCFRASRAMAKAAASVVT
jgi:hypothetical protein